MRRPLDVLYLADTEFRRSARSVPVAIDESAIRNGHRITIPEATDRRDPSLGFRVPSGLAGPTVDDELDRPARRFFLASAEVPRWVRWGVLDPENESGAILTEWFGFDASEPESGRRDDIEPLRR